MTTTQRFKNLNKTTGEKTMKKLSIFIEDDLSKLISNDAISNNVSIAEVIRRRLTDTYYSTQKQEEKIVKRFEEFEHSINTKLETMENKIMSSITKDIMYSMSNFHYLKFLTIHGFDKSVEEVKNLLSLAKSETLFNPTDSINSKKRFEANIKEEHLKS
jgi:hypothetical protein